MLHLEKTLVEKKLVIVSFRICHFADYDKLKDNLVLMSELICGLLGTFIYEILCWNRYAPGMNVSRLYLIIYVTILMFVVSLVP